MKGNICFFERKVLQKLVQFRQSCGLNMVRAILVVQLLELVATFQFSKMDSWTIPGLAVITLFDCHLLAVVSVLV